MSDGWIEIPRWDEFQHYKNRDPVWIKNHRGLLHSDAYMGLTLHQRGVLHGLWLEYAASGRQVRDSTATVSRQLGERVTRPTLDALNHAGFITYSASKPLAQRYHDASLEERESREEQTVLPSVASNPETLWDGEDPDGLTGELEQSQNGLPPLDAILKEIP